MRTTQGISSLGVTPFLLAVVVWQFSDGGAGPGTPLLLAQDEPPPIATCVPPLTPFPPGLYPGLRLERIEFTFTELEGICVGEGSERVIEACVRNWGPGFASAFTVRVQGCVERRVDILMPELDGFSDTACRTALAEPRVDGEEPCEILVDAECETWVNRRDGLHHFIRLPVPVPPPMCTPGPSPTASPSATAPATATEDATSTPSWTAAPSATATPSPTLHVDAPEIHFPLALANAEPVGSTAIGPPEPTPIEQRSRVDFQVADFGGSPGPCGSGWSISDQVGRAPRLTTHAPGDRLGSAGVAGGAVVRAGARSRDEPSRRVHGSSPRKLDTLGASLCDTAIGPSEFIALWED